MKKQTAKQLNPKLVKLIDRNEPSVYRNDAKDALKSKSPLDKQIAIKNYNSWLRS